MTFQEIWASLCKKRPLLNDPKATVEVSSDGFKNCFGKFTSKGKSRSR